MLVCLYIYDKEMESKERTRVRDTVLVCLYINDKEMESEEREIERETVLVCLYNMVERLRST